MELKGRICWLNRHAKRHADVSLASLVNKGTLTPRIQWDMSEDHFGLYAEYASHSALQEVVSTIVPVWKTAGNFTEGQSPRLQRRVKDLLPTGPSHATDYIPLAAQIKVCQAEQHLVA